MMKQRNVSPWAWIPTVYFAEGLPNVLVMVVSVTMYMQLGMSDTEIGIYTGWLQLPWVLKFIWSPFVDLYRTKRWWVIIMQLLMGASLAGVAFTLNTPLWFQGTMCCFFLMAFLSATHDVAADGYYMLELDEHQQSLFVGIRNTFYRIAVIFGQGVLIALAGVLQRFWSDNKAFTWSLIFYGLAALFIMLWLWHGYILPHAKADAERPSSAHEVLQGLKDTLVTFVTKVPWRSFVFVLLFLLFYRLPEAMLTKMCATFLQRPASEGGLGLSPIEFGIANGTVGLDDVNLTIQDGEFVAIIGRSGAGKSTLLRAVNRMHRITAGTLTVNGTDVSTLSGKALRQFRRGIGMVFQSFNLVTRTTVIKNVLSACVPDMPFWRVLLGAFRREDKLKALESLDKVGILDKAYMRADQLSGGQQQRVALARTLTQSPHIILADEPVAALDPVTAKQVMQDFVHINQEMGISILLNIHHVELALEYADRIIGIRAGKIVYDGPSAKVDQAVLDSIYGEQAGAEECV